MDNSMEDVWADIPCRSKFETCILTEAALATLTKDKN